MDRKKMEGEEKEEVWDVMMQNKEVQTRRRKRERRKMRSGRGGGGGGGGREGDKNMEGKKWKHKSGKRGEIN